jgi:hypothetical protein
VEGELFRPTPPRLEILAALYGSADVTDKVRVWHSLFSLFLILLSISFLFCFAYLNVTYFNILPETGTTLHRYSYFQSGK